MRLGKRARDLWKALANRAAQLRADTIEASRLAAAAPADVRRELDSALAAVLQPEERIELDTWSQLSRKQPRTSDPANIDGSTAVGVAQAAGTALGMLRGAIGWVDAAMPARIVVTDQRLLVSHRAVATPATVRAAPRSAARVVSHRLGTMVLDLGDGEQPLRLFGTLEGDTLSALADALGSGVS